MAVNHPRPRENHPLCRGGENFNALAVCSLKSRGLLDFLASPVQPPDGEVQHGGEAHPGQIRQEQQARHQRPPPEDDQGSNDGSPQKNDVDETQAKRVQDRVAPGGFPPGAPTDPNVRY